MKEPGSLKRGRFQMLKFFGRPIPSALREHIASVVPASVAWVHVGTDRFIDIEPEYVYYVLGWEPDGVEESDNGRYVVQRSPIFEHKVSLYDIDPDFVPYERPRKAVTQPKGQYVLAMEREILKKVG